MDRLLVILAGYAQEINKLISINPGLSSRFPEEINFKNMSPVQCLEILERTIQKRNIQTPALTNPDSQIHGKMVGLIEEFSALPSWGNARDMKTLAQNMVGFVFKASTSSPDPLAISEDDVFHLTKAMLKERHERCANLPTVLPLRTAQKAADQSQAPPPPPPPTEGSSTQADENTGPSNEPPEPTEHQDDNAESEDEIDVPRERGIARDAGVPDAIWAQLRADIAAANAEPKLSDEAVWDMNDVVSTTWEAAHQAELALRRLEAVKAKDEANAQLLKRQQEEARAEQEKARAERQKAKAEFERMRIQLVKQKREKAVQDKLRNMGVCVQGFQWIKQAGGYRCAGGSHYIANDRLGV